MCLLVVVESGESLATPRAPGWLLARRITADKRELL